MGSQESAEMRFKITSMHAAYKREPMTSRFGFMTPNPPMPKPAEMDPYHVSLILAPVADEKDNNGNLIMRKDDVKRLDLMVGDSVMLNKQITSIV